MQDYAINLDALKTAVNCYYDQDPTFWKCYINSFEKCVQKKEVDITQLYNAYRVYPNLSNALYNHQCFCKMDTDDVVQK